MDRSHFRSAKLDSDLVALKNLYDEYQQLRSLFEALKLNDMLQMSPNYDPVIGRLVQMGIASREAFQQKVLDVFYPIDIEPEGIILK